jgi:hypothetical protein
MRKQIINELKGRKGQIINELKQEIEEKFENTKSLMKILSFQ